MLNNNPNASYSDAQICDITQKTVKYLVAVWGVDVNIEYKAALKRRCYCRQMTSGKCTLVFGIKTQRIMMKHGGLWENRLGLNLRGINAVIAVAAHEYAHAIMYDYGWNEQKIEWHGKDWQEILLDMLKDLDKIF